jgi:subtilisin family serine protease
MGEEPDARLHEGPEEGPEEGEAAAGIGAGGEEGGREGGDEDIAPGDAVLVEVLSLREAIERKRPWHLSNPQVQSFLARAGTDGEGVAVAVLDTGVDATHPDLAHVEAFDMTGEGDPADREGHGTHVCGIVGGRGATVRGIAPGARVLSYKVFGADRHMTGRYILSSLDDILSGRRGRVDVVNMSLGWPVVTGGAGRLVADGIREQIRERLLRLAADGVLCVCAAGNEFDHTRGDAPRFGTVNYPAHFNSTIAVGSVDKAGTRSDFSSTGPKLTVMAPGGGIISTYPAALAPPGAPAPCYSVMSGTSMASPFMAGVLALVLAACDKRGAQRPGTMQVLWHLQRSARKMETPGYDFCTGYGCVDPCALLESIEGARRAGAPGMARGRRP